MDDTAGAWADHNDDGVPKRPVVTTLIGLMVVGWLSTTSPATHPIGAEVMMALAGVNMVLVAPITWLICFAIRLRKASAGWNVATLMIFCLVAFLVYLGGLATTAPAPEPVVQATSETPMMIPGVGDPRGLATLPSVDPHRAHRHRTH